MAAREHVAAVDELGRGEGQQEDHHVPAVQCNIHSTSSISSKVSILLNSDQSTQVRFFDLIPENSSLT